MASTDQRLDAASDLHVAVVKYDAISSRLAEKSDLKDVFCKQLFNG